MGQLMFSWQIFMQHLALYGEAKNIEAMRIRSRAWKKLGRSRWIDSSNAIHGFSVGDTKHAQSKCIEAKLADIAHKMSHQQGYSPGLLFVMLQRHIYFLIILRSWPLHVASSIRLKEKLFSSQRTCRCACIEDRDANNCYHRCQHPSSF